MFFACWQESAPASTDSSYFSHCYYKDCCYSPGVGALGGDFQSLCKDNQAFVYVNPKETLTFLAKPSANQTNQSASEKLQTFHNHKTKLASHSQ